MSRISLRVEVVKQKINMQPWPPLTQCIVDMRVLVIPCIMEATVVLDNKPKTLVTEAHLFSANKANPIVSLIISISIFLLIAFLLFTALGPRLASFTSTLTLLRLDELLLVLRNILLIYYAGSITVVMVLVHHNRKIIKTYGWNIECY